MLNNTEICQTLLDLQHSEVRIRRAAGAIVSRNSDQFPQDAIHVAYAREPDPLSRSWLALSLGLMGYQPAVRTLQARIVKGLDEQQPHEEWSCIGRNMIVGKGSEQQVGLALDSSDPLQQQRGLIDSFHIWHKSTTLTQRVERLAFSPHTQVRRWAIMVLARTHNYSSHSLLLEKLSTDDDAVVREWSAWGLSMRSLRAARKTAAKLYARERSPRVREWLANAVFDISPRGSKDLCALAERYTGEPDLLAKEGMAKRLVQSGDAFALNFVRSELRNHSTWFDLSSHEARLLMGTLARVFFRGEMQRVDYEVVEPLIGRVDDRTRDVLLNAVLAQPTIRSTAFMDLLADDRLQYLLRVVHSHRSELQRLAVVADQLATVMPVVTTRIIRQRIVGETHASISQISIIAEAGRENPVHVHQEVHCALVGGDIVQVVRGVKLDVHQEVALTQTSGRATQSYLNK